MAARNCQDKLFPDIVDHIAETEPEALYTEYPVSTLTYDQGYRKITYQQFASAINGVAQWLHDTLGPPKGNEVLVYIGPNDIRYPALILGAVKAGYVIFLTSPRNSVAAQLKLLDDLNCKTILSPTPRPPPVTAILESNSQFRVLNVSSVDDLLSKIHPHFPFNKSFFEARHERLFVVHTSGSTGFPKPITFTHDVAAAHFKMMSLDPPPGFECLKSIYQGKRIFSAFPPFHAASLACLLFVAIPLGGVIINPISGAIPSANGLVSAMKQTDGDLAFIVPSILGELGENPKLLEICAERLETIVYCGGDLPQAIGDVVASKIKLINQFGATEVGIANFVVPKHGHDREDWKYINFHPETGAEFKHSVDDTYELTFVRKPELAEPPTFKLFPHLEVYATSDLFVRHPSPDKSNLWKWKARADDIIVFLSGEKTNPISMEQHIVARNPNVQAALVMGAQRFQTSLLIEPVNVDVELSASERAVFIEKIWPSVEEANHECPNHAKIAKTHIFFTHPKKPMLRAGKGTIQRAGTLQLYEAELDSLYKDADSMDLELNQAFQDISLDVPSDVSVFVSSVILADKNWENCGPDDDLFANLGMDSLQALTAVRKLRRGLRIPSIALSTLYTNPTIAKLTDAVIKLSKHNSEEGHDAEAAKRLRSSMLKEYYSQIDMMSPPSPPSHGLDMEGEVIILTGSTGTLGSHILSSLLQNPRVARIYCLNRAASSKGLRESRHIPAGISDSRVTFLTTTLSSPLLGLDQQTYSALLKANLIIHNAWPVNFNLSLVSFRSSIQGLVNLITLTASTARAKLFFVSSISSVIAYQTPSGLTPEAVIPQSISEKFSVIGPNGYAESKYLSELLLHYASEKFSSGGHRFSFARVGQIAGLVKHKGVWNKTEWLPSLVLSSLHIGAIPDSLGAILERIDWVPVDLLADIIVELSLGGTEHEMGDSTIEVFHPLNPKPSTWGYIRQELVAAASSNPGPNVVLEVIPLQLWISKIKKDMEMKAGSGIVLKNGELEKILKLNPAAKLLEFYAGLLGGEGKGNIFETVKTEKVSGSLKALEGVKGEWVVKWLSEWVGL